MSTAEKINVLDQFDGKGWVAYHGDCVDVLRGLPDDSIHYSIFSPPFASLYTYSASDRDMGNVKDAAEFAKHFAFLVPELLRVVKPGRLISLHCMNLPTSKARDGFIGLSDFRGELIRTFVAAGWIYHSEVCIWKDPVTAMQRTKALGLLHKQIEKDSCMSRQGIADYLVTFRKPGVNHEPVDGYFETFVGEETRAAFEAWCKDAWQRKTGQDGITMSLDQFRSIAIWQRYASPVWMDIDPTRTLQYMSAREHADERHVCPLQLDVIERALDLWTNPGDVVLSPFMGIGSEGYCALKTGRRFVGAELKASYYSQAVRNLEAAKPEVSLMALVGAIEEPARAAEVTTEAEVGRTYTDDLEEERDALKMQIEDLESELEASRRRVSDLEKEIEEVANELEESQSDVERLNKERDQDPRAIAAAFHDFMREEGLITDAARDVPFRATLTDWRNKVEKIAEEALS